jgi:hypothetical protein
VIAEGRPGRERSGSAAEAVILESAGDRRGPAPGVGGAGEGVPVDRPPQDSADDDGYRLVMQPEREKRSAFVPVSTSTPALTSPVATSGGSYAPVPLPGLVHQPPSRVSGDFDPSAYRISVDSGRGGILIRALTTVMKSPTFLEAAERIRDEGGATIKWDGTMEHKAHWDLRSRTIFLNPAMIEKERMVIAGILAFELGNASQAREFEDLLESVKTGRVTDAQEYAERAERIEYRSAQLRARDSAELMRRGTWTGHVDTTLRHFIPEGQALQPAFGNLIQGTGLWASFEGYQQTQMVTGHTQGLVERFARLPGRAEYLQSREGRIAEAKRRFQQRQEAKVTAAAHQGLAPAVGSPPVASSSGSSGTRSTRDPESFVHPDDRPQLRGDDAQRHVYRGVDGHSYKLFAVVEGEFYFKPVG